MHPEYPCAHCSQASSMASVLEAVIGSADIPEVAITRPTAPGVTHRWTNLRAFVAEVSEHAFGLASITVSRRVSERIWAARSVGNALSRNQ